MLNNERNHKWKCFLHGSMSLRLLWTIPFLCRNRENLYLTLPVLHITSIWRQVLVTICLLSWWRHQMETFSALLALCVGNSPATGEFPTQRPVTRSFDDFFDLRLNKQLCKNHEAGDLRRHRAHYDVIVMQRGRGFEVISNPYGVYLCKKSHRGFM